MADVQVSFADDFFDRIAKLDPADYKRSVDAVNDLRRNPDAPGLRLKQLAGGLKGLWSVRAAQGLRVLLTRRGDSFVAIDAGPRQSIYDRANRGAFLINPATGFVGFTERHSATPEHSSASVGTEPTDDTPKPFDHWSDLELVEAGLDVQLAALRSLRTADQVLELDVSDETLELLIEILELTPEQWRRRATIDTSDAEAVRATKAEDEELLVDMVTRFGARTGLSPFFSAEELEKLLAAPIEDWMLFLHPDQRVVTERHFAGPARVRGPAGTGKTVVLLHRAAVLADRYADPTDKILVTTYVSSLPPVLDRLFRRLPTANAERVEFTNVDKLARAVCKRAGVHVVVNPLEADTAFNQAWRASVTAGSPIERAKLSRSYLQEEIRSVIKGRGIALEDLYLNVKRTGRRTPLNAEVRTQVWALAEAWDARLAERGICDFADVILKARDIARAADEATYRAALIDEAQDLTLAGLQLIRALVNGPGPDRPDGLFIAGDGAQRIYSGGFTLQQAGVDVRGRSTVLRKNYRNTTEVLSAAVSVAGKTTVSDLDEDFVLGADVESADRTGRRPELIVSQSSDEQLAAITSRVTALATDADADAPVFLGDIAVCCPTNKTAKAIKAALQEAGLPTIELKDYDGDTVEAVKVGTHDRAKGLEFKVVILPDLSASTFLKPHPGQAAAEAADYEATGLARLYVAMTRARDHLILSCVDDAAAVLDPILDQVDLST